MKDVTTNNQIDFKFADSAMNQFVAFVVEKFTSLDQKISTLDQKIGTLDNKVNKLDKKLESHTEMIGQLLVNVQELKDVAHAHNDMIHELKDDSKDVKRGLVQINRKLDQKVDVKDLKRLENRVLVLESI